MLAKPENCRGCPLYGNGFGFVVPEGLNASNIYIIGESAGINEKKDGKPFRPYAQSGSKLEETFRLTHTKRDNFKLYNIVNCQPPGNKLEHMPYEVEAIARCRYYLDKVVKPNNSNVILALGNVAMKNLTGITSDNAKLSISNLRGIPIESDYGIVIPSYHPSFVRRGKPNYTQYLIWDLQKAIKVRKHGVQKPSLSFNIHPSYQEIKDFYFLVKSRSDAVLMYDIETDDSLDTEEDERSNLNSNTITRIQFSITKDKAITFPWMDEYLKVVKLLFMLPNRKMGHNSYNFDNPRLKDKGMVLNGELHDSMWMFKHLYPGLERGLQKVSSCADYPFYWKHLSGEDETNYACHDVNSMHYIWEWIVPNMIEEGIWS